MHWCLTSALKVRGFREICINYLIKKKKKSFTSFCYCQCSKQENSIVCLHICKITLSKQACPDWQADKLSLIDCDR